ncbi:MAG: hypothetical protein JOY62_09830 [Acidobacteriaceae bacterium]|nr:hypothetical protein [Acidobacteriaceae bacterium]MBV9780258.1 hypothetical protein [Acidobacteriaceae bacterium]
MDRSLAIIEAGVQDSEDAPFVPSDYQFLPGEFVYSTFKIAGFTVKSEDRGAVERISLGYEVTPQDSKGIALASPTSGTIEVEVNPEDKNWMPMRRCSFLIPSYVAAGEFRIHVVAKDLFSGTEAAKDVPFRIGGTVVQLVDKVAVQNFRFLRQENDRHALDVAAYRPGDTVHISFEVIGYKLGPQNQYRLAYTVTVLRPDGKPFLPQPQTGELAASTFYPAQFVPANFNLTTSGDSARGEYIILLTIRDLIGNQFYQMREPFSLE